MLKYRKILFCLVIILFSSYAVCATPAVYLCQKTRGDIQIDGVLDESSWQTADKLHFVIPVSLDTPQDPTVGKVLWDNENLYVGMVATDNDIKAVLTHHDDSTYLDDALEVFLKPDLEGESYVNFEINALGTVYDALNEWNFETRRHRVNMQWNCNELQKGIKINGTLNLSTDTDRNWTLELKIPFSCLTSFVKSPPKPGDRWLFHLARYDYSGYLPKGRELTSCAPLTRVNFHNYRDWITLEFQK